MNREQNECIEKMRVKDVNRMMERNMELMREKMLDHVRDAWMDRDDMAAEGGKA